MLSIIINTLQVDPILTALYLVSGLTSLSLGFSLIKYYRVSRKITAKYLGTSITAIGFSILSYLYAFLYYSETQKVSVYLMKLLGLSNILIALGLLFLIYYLHLIIRKRVSVIAKIAYAFPIFVMFYFLINSNEINYLRMYLGYSLFVLTIILLIYIIYFIKISVRIYRSRDVLPEVRIGAVTHIIAMILAILAITIQLIGKLYHQPLFSITASLSLALTFGSLALLYLPTTLPSWYVKLSKKILS